MQVQPITLTENAALKIRSLMAEEKVDPAEAYLRVGVQGGGCSGLKYRMVFEKAPGPRDRVVEDASGIRVLVDPKSFLFLNGIELDYTDSIRGVGFQFSNPNAKRGCGCGSSFSA